jgi:hypothetical protein
LISIAFYGNSRGIPQKSQGKIIEITWNNIETAKESHKNPHRNPLKIS